MPSRMNRRAVLAAGASLLAGAASAQPGWKPSRVATIVVPYPAGGSNDTFARQVAKELGDRLGQPVIIDNRPGASGNTGTGQVARAAPDGYTLVAVSSSMTTNAAIQSRLPFDPVKSVAPVAMFAFPTLWLANMASLWLPVSNLTNLLARGHLDTTSSLGFLALAWPVALTTTLVPLLCAAVIWRPAFRSFDGHDRPGRRSPCTTAPDDTSASAPLPQQRSARRSVAVITLLMCAAILVVELAWAKAFSQALYDAGGAVIGRSSVPGPGRGSPRPRWRAPRTASRRRGRRAAGRR